MPLEVLLYEQPRSASDLRIRQEQRMIQLYSAVDQAREEVWRITAEIRAELPGRLPRGVVVTADSVSFPELGE